MLHWDKPAAQGMGERVSHAKYTPSLDWRIASHPVVMPLDGLLDLTKFHRRQAILLTQLLLITRHMIYITGFLQIQQRVCNKEGAVRRERVHRA
jgi:hypothetical protein